MASFDEISNYFQTSAVAHVATLLPDGAPHSVPVWIGVEDGRLLFFTLAGSRKDRNLAADPRIAFSITRPDEPLAMAYVRGRVVERVEGDAAMPYVDRIAQRYTGEPYDIRSGLAAFLVEPEISGSTDYSNG